MSEFILATFVLLIMLLKKYFFFNLEASYASSFWGILEILGFSLLFIFGFIAFVKGISKRKKQKRKKAKRKIDYPVIILLIATGFVVLMSFYLNSIKVSLHWDAIALYDARAKFLAGGMKFSEMPGLSEFDNLNKHYYLLYPPYTSIGHLFWDKISFLSRFPVGVYYSIALSLMIAIVFFLTKGSLGIKGGAFLVLLIVSNSSIFNITVKEYTNLPYALHMVAGTFFLFSYLKTKKPWKLIYGIFLISTSIWIRILEPMWLPVIIAFGLVIFSKKDIFKSLLPAIILATFSLLQYFSWAYFANVIGNNPTAIEVSTYGFIEPFFGILTGAPWIVLVVFVEAWGIPFLIHLLTLIVLALKWKYVVKNKDILFLALVLALCISLYYFQFYFLSFQVEWWDIVAKSLDRSSTFLIPLSGYLLIRMITSSEVLTKRS
jgi:hypothetical protein